MRTVSRGRVWPVLALPGLWLAAFFLLPFAIVAKISLSESATAQPPYRPQLAGILDAAAWRAFLEGLGFDNYRLLVADDLYWSAGLSSLRIAALSTVLLALIGYPMALAIARAPERWRPLLVALTVVPFWTSLLIRIYAWIAILKPEGWLNGALIGAGLIRTPLSILNTEAAVLIGIVYAYLPFMVLPLYGSLERHDRALVEAASDLGASPLRAFWTVTFPLSLRGLAAGALLCFVPIVGEFIIPDLLGGSDTLMLGRTLWSEFFANRDWPLASAVAVAMTLILVGPILAHRALEARRAEGRA
ncbi:MAG: potB [Enterovirga sp.]|nr:potB [Enterovirga sp.]